MDEVWVWCHFMTPVSSNWDCPNIAGRKITKQFFPKKTRKLQKVQFVASYRRLLEGSNPSVFDAPGPSFACGKGSTESSCGTGSQQSGWQGGRENTEIFGGTSKAYIAHIWIVNIRQI